MSALESLGRDVQDSPRFRAAMRAEYGSEPFGFPPITTILTVLGVVFSLYQCLKDLNVFGLRTSLRPTSLAGKAIKGAQVQYATARAAFARDPATSKRVGLKDARAVIRTLDEMAVEFNESRWRDVQFELLARLAEQDAMRYGDEP